MIETTIMSTSKAQMVGSWDDEEDVDNENANLVQDLKSYIKDDELSKTMGVLTGKITNLKPSLLPDLSKHDLVSDTDDDPETAVEDIQQSEEGDDHFPMPLDTPPAAARDKGKKPETPAYKHRSLSIESPDSQYLNIIRKLQEQMAEHDTKLTSVLSTLAAQTVVIDQLSNENTMKDIRIGQLEMELEKHKISNAETLSANYGDCKKRIEDAVSVLRDTPAVVERIIDSANKVISTLPDDIKSKVKKVELSSADAKTIQNVKKAIEKPPAKIPDHVRKMLERAGRK
ncbi:glycoprotein 1 [Botrytis cinerea negative-stranded RNA virus 3]|uniref:Glycoprotein 1 n=1 Tax=Botrytis cinerea negative-stranded RNA virus 3 TaxID=2735938 RepID=A0AAE7DT45_9MONO|nr:glycoprotein 1 [Botrytis cinerea negative-stranded RNA virus 3]QJW39405.1 glycoprotein 1 [Botrytis cinerea negative-stranded RNA virus 3]